METLKLISEEIQDVEYITEQKEGGKKDYKIKGIFMQADIKNRNGRIYPMEVLEKEVRRYNKDHIQQKRAFGELGHPEGPTINLERASHMITSLAPDGKNFIGEAKILKTPMGKIVENLMDEGAKLGVSSRGMGSLNQKNGANYVRNDFYLATAADIVERGIVLTGGGALLGELDTTIREATGLPVVIAEDPLTCVVMGTGRCLDEMKSLRNVLIGA